MLYSPTSTERPSPVHKSRSIGELSVVQRSSTVEVRGRDADVFPSFLGTCEFFYDSCAGAFPSPFRTGNDLTTAQLFDLVSAAPTNGNTSRYENPLITATSRALISDIHALTRRCCAVDVPRPWSILLALIRSRPPNKSDDDPWFRAVRIWPEVEDISETESFDGHKKSFVDYTLNVLFFPDLHATYRTPNTLVLRRPPSSPADSQLSLSVPASPSLTIPGTAISMPSPLHFQLPIMTRLIFNEQGQITYHRDVWDFGDVVRLIPGVRVMLWVMSRASAWGLSWIGRRVCSIGTGAPHDDTSDENGVLTTTADASV